MFIVCRSKKGRDAETPRQVDQGWKRFKSKLTGVSPRAMNTTGARVRRRSPAELSATTSLVGLKRPRPAEASRGKFIRELPGFHRLPSARLVAVEMTDPAGRLSLTGCIVAAPQMVCPNSKDTKTVELLGAFRRHAAPKRVRKPESIASLPGLDTAIAVPSLPGFWPHGPGKRVDTPAVAGRPCDERERSNARILGNHRNKRAPERIAPDRPPEHAIQNWPAVVCVHAASLPLLSSHAAILPTVAGRGSRFSSRKRRTVLSSTPIARASARLDMDTLASRCRILAVAS